LLSGEGRPAGNDSDLNWAERWLVRCRCSTRLAAVALERRACNDTRLLEHSTEFKSSEEAKERSLARARRRCEEEV